MEGDAEIIYPDGTRKSVRPADRHFTLEELYAYLKCQYIEVLPLSEDKYMILDEEGKLRPNEPNPTATKLLHLAGLADTAVGIVLVTEAKFMN